MKITIEKLEKLNACNAVMKWFKGQRETDAVKIVEKLITENKIEWANWFVLSALNREDKIRYSCFAARQVLDIFEKKYPNDKRPRLAVEAAEMCIKNNTNKNRNAADAADAADAAADAADAAAYAAYAADAADAAADAADAAAYAAYAAAYAADAAYAAAYAAYAADAAAKAVGFNEMKIKIIKYGMGLIK